MDFCFLTIIASNGLEIHYFVYICHDYQYYKFFFYDRMLRWFLKLVAQSWNSKKKMDSGGGGGSGGTAGGWAWGCSERHSNYGNEP